MAAREPLSEGPPMLAPTFPVGTPCSEPRGHCERAPRLLRYGGDLVVLEVEDDVLRLRSPPVALSHNGLPRSGVLDVMQCLRDVDRPPPAGQVLGSLRDGHDPVELAGALEPPVGVEPADVVQRQHRHLAAHPRGVELVDDVVRVHTRGEDVPPHRTQRGNHPQVPPHDAVAFAGREGLR
ncbi:phosphomannomutase 1, isoform CRA_b [Babesia caballi]|uniref:Phosphomannomutase 1, isoform CRA_b n=1 Tax=Babesia caballi TaxID=5871 RepID=A0AAV4LMM8_BABCB|nr:phosphomannomutase 1, isoform CRA_b [Babesia caballi]